MSLALSIQNYSIHNLNHLQSQIHLRAIDVSSRYKKAEAELIDALEQAEQHKVYLLQGHSSLFQYGVKELGLSENVIYTLITVMRKTKEVPELKTEIVAGNITLSNAKRIAPILTVENQTQWLKKAQELSQRELEKEVIKVRPLSAVSERASYITESRMKLELGMSEDGLIKLRKAQDLLSQSESKHVSLEDTIIKISEFYLQHHDPVLKAKRSLSKKVVHKDNLENSSKSKTTSIDELASRRVKAKTRLPLHQQSRKPIPADILHQVNLRDERQCTFVNTAGVKCNQSRWIEIHHRVPVHQGGKNTLENLTTLCSTHHKWVHSG